MQLRWVRFSVLAMTLLSVLPLSAQVVGGTISGAVSDQSGAALSGATVVVRQTETGASRKLVTGSDGRYAAPSIPVGSYEVTVSHEGFATQTRTGIQLAMAQSLVVDLTLGLDTVHQDVVVESAPSSVNTTTQQTSGLIGRAPGEGTAAERAQLRPAADAQPGHR